MNIQTELLENQTARVTAEIDPDRFDKAKQIAARKISKRVRIPGFRKGKAPYRILVQNGLEDQIIMDAFEELYQDIYTEALEQSDLDPYGPGMFEKYELDPPTLIYIVSLQPKIELNDYQSVREDYEAPEVTDDEVDRVMKSMQEQHALVEESTRPVALNNRVTADVHSEFADDPQSEAPEGAESETDASEVDTAEGDEPEVDAETEEKAPEKGAPFIHEHDATIPLDPDLAPILPGFSEALVGAKVDDTVVFDLTVPEDNDNYADVAGRQVNFSVTIKKVETVTLPTMNDDFAARVTEEEDEPLTLLQLRVRARENLEKNAESRARETYSRKVIDQMVAGADMVYPEVMVQDQISMMLQDLEERLKQQKISMQVYLNVMGQTEEQLRESYREPATNSIERTLLLQEIVQQNNIHVHDDKVEARIDEILQQFGEQAENLRSAFDTPEMRGSVMNDLLNEKVLDFIIAIGKGEDPVIEDVHAEAEEALEADDDTEIEETTDEDAEATEGTPEEESAAEVASEETGDPA